MAIVPAKPASAALPESVAHSEPPPPTALIVVAAGAGSRMRADTKKPYLELAGEPILFHTLRRFKNLAFIRRRIVVVAPDDVQRVRTTWPELERDLGVTHIVAGGNERVDSVYHGLIAACSADTAGNAAADTNTGTTAAAPTAPSSVELVAIHDGVRPFVAPAAIVACCRAAATHGSAILAAPVHDTIKRSTAANADAGEPAFAVETVDRRMLWAAQTPQVFRVSVIRDAFENWRAAGCPPVTDDASLIERLGGPVALVPSPTRNLKITTPADLPLAAFLIAQLWPDG